MQAASKTRYFNASRLIYLGRRALIDTAFVLLIIVALDYCISGNMHVDNVEFRPTANEKPIILSLPFNKPGSTGVIQPSEPGTIHRFKFDVPQSPLNHLFPLRILGKDCIRKVVFNEEYDATLRYYPPELCNANVGVNLSDFGVPLTDIKTVSVEVEDIPSESFNTALWMKRDALFKPLHYAVMVFASLLMLLLAHTKTKAEFRHVAFAGLAVFLFLFPIFWRTVDVYFWWSRVDMLARGPALVLLLIALSFWPPLRPVYQWADRCLLRAAKIPPRYFMWGCTLTFLVLTICLSHIMFWGMPHLNDTIIQYVHAKIMMQGKLYEQSHPLTHLFNFYNAINDGKYYGITFPGNVFLIAAAMKIGMPWLVNPLMGALTVAVSFLLAREIAGKHAGYVAALLTLMSPPVVFMSSEYMNHTACMFFLTLFLYGYVRWCKTGLKRFALLAGASVGYAFITRLQATVLFAAPIGIHMLWMLWQAPKARWRSTLVMALSFGVFVAYNFVYNYLTTGKPLLFPYVYLSGPFNNTMYSEFAHWERWLKIPRDLDRVESQIFDTHTELFAWPTSSLWGVFLLFALRACPRYGQLLMWCVVGNILALIFIYPDKGTHWFINRYVYESSSSLIILTAIFLTRVPPILRHRFRLRLSPQKVRPIIALSVGILSLAGVPYRVMDLYKWYSYNYCEVDMENYTMIMNKVEKPAVVMAKDKNQRYYFTNPPYDSNEVIFVPYRDDFKAEVMDYYPKRHIYISDYWRLEKIR